MRFRGYHHGDSFSSQPRYDHFDTSPYISTAALPRKSESTTGENRIFNSSPQALLSLAPSGFSLGSLPRWTHDFETDNDQNCPTKHFAFLNIPERDEKSNVNIIAHSISNMQEEKRNLCGKVCKSVKHRLHPKRSEEVKGRVEICEANTTRP